MTDTATPAALAWTPDPGPAILPGKLSPGIPGQSVDSPVPNADAVVNIMAVRPTWDFPDPIPTLTQKLSPGIPGQSVDNPLPNHVAVVNMMAVRATWEPPDPPPTLPRNLSPGIPGQTVDRPMPNHRQRWVGNVIRSAWDPPDPQPFVGGMQPTAKRMLDPDDLDDTINACKNCAFFIDIVNGDGSSGLCRRYPARITLDINSSSWPVVHRVDWCGEYVLGVSSDLGNCANCVYFSLTNVGRCRRYAANYMPSPESSPWPHVLSTDACGEFWSSLILPAIGTWNGFIPILHASSGTFTNATASGRCIRVGTLFIYQVEVVITTNGTAAGAILLDLPVLANSDAAGTFVQLPSGNSGSIKIAAADNTLHLMQYNGGYPGGDNITVVGSGIIEIDTT